MRKLFTALAMVVMVLQGLGPVWAEKPIKMDLNAVYAQSSWCTQGAMEFAKLVEAYSDGSVAITVHPGGALGFKGPELLKVVKDGQVPMSDILMGNVAGSAQVFGISSLPRLVDSYEQARKMYDLSKPLYEKGCAEWNQKLLFAGPWPPSGLVTEKPIAGPGDIKGIKVRTFDKNGADFLLALDAATVSLPWGEVYQSLRTGMINSVLTSAESTKDGKLYEVLKNFKAINYAYPLNMVTINLDYWQALSAKQQQAMLKAAAEIEKRQWDGSPKNNEEALSIIKSNGVTLAMQEEPVLTAGLDKAAEKVVTDFLEKTTPEIKAVINQMRQ